jgi:hypothetical protein
MTVRSALEWSGTILFGIVVGVSGASADLRALESAIRSAVAPVERPPQVDAFVAKLKTSPVLQALDVTPTSCGRVPKHPPRDRCYYRSGDIVAMTAWSRRSHRILGLIIKKTVPRGSAPFAWADLPNTLRLLCRQIEAGEANTIAREISERLLRANWYLKGDRVSVAVDGATRGIVVAPRETCVFRLSEHDYQNAIHATLDAGPFKAD